MYTEKRGCLIQAVLNQEVDIMLHVVNCKGVMNAGIAKQVRRDLREAYVEYKMLIDAVAPKSTLGQISLDWHQLRCINLHAQENYGRSPLTRYIDYGALIQCLKQVLKVIDQLSGGGAFRPKIGIPQGMGAGLANGDWDTILEITDAMIGTECDLYVYEL